jgi:hypothetical protein
MEDLGFYLKEGDLRLFLCTRIWLVLPTKKVGNLTSKFNGWSHLDGLDRLR